MSAPDITVEVCEFLESLGAVRITLANGECYFRVPGHFQTYTLAELIEAYGEDRYAHTLSN